MISSSSILAWNLVKTCKKLHREKPAYETNELPLGSKGFFQFSNFVSPEFDFWFKLSNHGKQRLMIPCKKTKVFNTALSKGFLKRNSCKIWKSHKGHHYLIVYVEFPDRSKENVNKLGIDVGHYNAIATSEGKILGQDIWSLRLKTKHRNYKGKVTPNKQLLNYYAKQLHVLYPDADFVCEDLKFKGKRIFGHKQYRTLRSKWAYQHLSNKLVELGQTEGFCVYKVNPFNTSRTCPKCGFATLENRKGDVFKCIKCDHTDHADITGAINILMKEYPVSLENVNLIRKSY